MLQPNAVNRASMKPIARQAPGFIPAGACPPQHPIWYPKPMGAYQNQNRQSPGTCNHEPTDLRNLSIDKVRMHPVDRHQAIHIKV